MSVDSAVDGNSIVGHMYVRSHWEASERSECMNGARGCEKRLCHVISSPSHLLIDVPVVSDARSEQEVGGRAKVVSLHQITPSTVIEKLNTAGVDVVN